MRSSKGIIRTLSFPLLTLFWTCVDTFLKQDVYGKRMAASLCPLSDGWRRASLPQSSTKHAGDESHGPDLGHVPFFNQLQWPWWWKHFDWLGLDHMIFLHWNEDIGKSFMQAMWTKIGAQADSLRRPGDTQKKTHTQFFKIFLLIPLNLKKTTLFEILV